MTTTFAEKLQEVLPQVRAHRADIEAARRVPDDIARAIGATGIYRLGAPKGLGGEEAAPVDILRASETVATADASVGWCSVLGLAGAMAAGYMRPDGAKEVYTDLTVPTAGIIAPAGAALPEDGGYRLSGRWAFGSGVTNADWVFLGATVMENGAPRMTPMGPEQVHLYVRTSDVQIHDTWYVSGLAGTGSIDVSVEDLHVPERFGVALFDLSRHLPAPLFQISPLTMFCAQIAAVALGTARAAIDDLSALAIEKVPGFSFVPLAQKPVTQTTVARAEGRLGGARAFLYDTIEDTWQTVVQGREVSPRQRALARIAAAQAAETSAWVASEMAALAGSSAIYAGSEIQRHARDTDAIRRHMTLSPQTWEEAGRVLFGFDPTFPVF